jgi:hypothetical protein
LKIASAMYKAADSIPTCGLDLVRVNLWTSCFSFWVAAYLSLVAGTFNGLPFNPSLRVAKYHYMTTPWIVLISVHQVLSNEEYSVDLDTANRSATFSSRICSLIFLAFLVFWSPIVTYRLHRAWHRGCGYFWKSILADTFGSFIGTLCAVSSSLYISLDRNISGAASVLVNGFGYPFLCTGLRVMLKRYLNNSLGGQSIDFNCGLVLILVSLQMDMRCLWYFKVTVLLTLQGIKGSSPFSTAVLYIDAK